MRSNRSWKAFRAASPPRSAARATSSASEVGTKSASYAAPFAFWVQVTERASVELDVAKQKMQPFVDAMLAKYPYWRELVQRVTY